MSSIFDFLILQPTDPCLCLRLQYIDNVINNGTPQYTDAYFELNYIRAFSLNASSVVDSNGNPVSSGGASASLPLTTSAGPSPSGVGNTGTDTGTDTNAARTILPVGVTVCVASVVAAVSWMLL